MKPILGRVWLPVLVLCSSALSGCTTISTDEAGRKVTHHFGYARVTDSPSRPITMPFDANSTTLVGLSVGKGIALGYKTKSVISVPLDCRILVVVENDAQLDHIISHLSHLKDERLCATVSPE